MHPDAIYEIRWVGISQSSGKSIVQASDAEQAMSRFKSRNQATIIEIKLTDYVEVI